MAAHDHGFMTSCEKCRIVDQSCTSQAEATAPPPKRRKQAATAVSSDQKVSNGTVLHAADSEAASLCFQSFPKG